MNEWTNWSGGVRARPAGRVEVAGVEALCDLVAHSDGPLRVIGSGHSFSPLLAGEATQVVLSGLDHVTEDRGGILAGAGVVLADLTARMHDLGHALANMGDVDGQRLGGALATGTHGTGAAFPCYCAMLRELTLVDGRGAVQTLTRAGDADAFRAMAVGLGTGGIVTQALIDTVPAYRLAKRRFALPLGDLLDDFDALMRAGRNTEFYYVPFSGAVLGLRSDETAGPLVARPPDRDQQALRQLDLATRALWRMPGLRRWLLGRLMLRHATERFTEDWHRAYPTDRDRIRFEETEWHIPAEAGADALRQIVAMIERDFPRLYFPIEVRMTRGDDLFLSPFFGGDRVSIAVHQAVGQPFDALMAAVQDIALRHDARPHWGKRHGLTAADCARFTPIGTRPSPRGAISTPRAGS